MKTSPLNSFRFCALIVVLSLVFSQGCATSRTSDTSRTGIEQLLISNAVDQALSKFDFAPLAGRTIYLQEKYMDGVDKNYVLASVRHRILATGGKLADKEESADVIMEIRSGGIGTDRVDSFVGSPQVAVPFPLPLQLPEVRLVDTKTQTASAKVAIVAYDAKTRHAIGTGGMSLARSSDVNRFVFGAGPFNSGDVKNEVAFATGKPSVTSSIAQYMPQLPTSMTASQPIAPQAPVQGEGSVLVR